MLETHISLIDNWLDAVHVESAARRAGDMRAKDQLRDLDAVLSDRGDVTRASWHEAAHAVVACLQGFKIDYARVRWDGSGVVHYQANHDHAYELFATAIVDLAGIACELLAGSDRSRQFALAHCYDLLTARVRIDRFQALAPGWKLTHKIFAG